MGSAEWNSQIASMQFNERITWGQNLLYNKIEAIKKLVKIFGGRDELYYC